MQMIVKGASKSPDAGLAAKHAGAKRALLETTSAPAMMQQAAGTNRGQDPPEAPALLNVPPFVQINDWIALSGMSRTVTYGHIKSGNIVARKVGGRTLIETGPSFAWMRSLPRLHEAA